MKIKTVVIGFATMVAFVGCKEEKVQGTVALPKVNIVEVGNQTICPVMGGKVDKNQFVDVKGYRIYVCCAGCNEKILADPMKYVTKLQEQGVTLAATPQK